MIIIDTAAWIGNIFILGVSMFVWMINILLIMYIINVITERIKKWNSPV